MVIFMNIRILQKIITTIFPSFLFFAAYAFASDSIPDREYVRPANVPDDYIVTPNGYFHPSCVHEIKNDEIQSAGLVIEKANGDVRKIEKCNFSNFSKHGVERTASDNVFAQKKIEDGWQLYAGYTLSDSLGELLAMWNVPDDPLLDQQQTLYFFPGVQQNPTVSILQPVLGWNQLGQKGWTLSSWNCCEAGTVTHSTPIKTYAKQLNQGRIYFDNKLGGYYIESVTLENNIVQNRTSLATRNYNQPVNWVLGGVMENYHVWSCDGLPSNRSMTFKNITVIDRNNKIIDMPFQAYDHDKICNYGLSIDSKKINSTIKFDF